MSEQPLDLRSSLRALWRGRLLLCGLAAIGAAFGVAYCYERPPMPTATAQVLLPPSSLTPSGTPTIDTSTQIVIATSNPVLSAAGRAVSPPLAPAALKRQLNVTAIGDQVLQIEARAPRPRQAEQLANAVAASYVRFVTDPNPNSSRSSTAGLLKESSELTQEIDSLQNQINAISASLGTATPGSAAAQEDASLLGSLGDEQRQIGVELDNVNDQIVSVQQSNSLLGSSTEVLQRATTATTGSKLRLAIGGGIGLGVGLLLGIILVLSRANRDRRLRQRDEIAGGIGVGVIGSLSSGTYRTAQAWRRLFEGYEPSPTDAWTLQRVLNRLDLGRSDRVELRLLAFAADSPAIAIAPQLAAFAAQRGIPTALVPGEHPALVPLRGACTLYAPSARADQLLSVPGSDTSLVSDAQLVVVLEALDRAEPALASTAGLCLLSVSSGFSTADDLARLALAAADASQTIDGVLVVNPEPNDTTMGSVTDQPTAVGTARRAKPRMLHAWRASGGLS